MYVHTKLIRHQSDVLSSFFNNEYGFHCTLMYDSRNILHVDGFPTRTKFSGVVKDIIFLGDSDILALELISPELEQFHEKLIRMGYKHSFDDFLPHMSLEYNFSAKDKNKIKIAEMFKGTKLQFEGIYISEVS